MDRQTHARYLEYRARHGYFARGDAPLLGADAFGAADAELRVLEALAEEARTDEEEARLAELRIALFVD